MHTTAAPVLIGMLGVLLAGMHARAQSLRGLGTLPGGSSSIAAGVSADGSVVVGTAYRTFPQPNFAFRWTLDDGMVELPIPLAARSSYASDVSADGASIAGGLGIVDMFPEASIWIGEADPLSLGRHPERDEIASTGISGDGRVVVGVAGEFDFNSRAFRWSAEAGLEDLGMLPGHAIALAYAANHDGSVVVGVSAIYFHIARLPFEAFRWTRETGMVGLGGQRSYAYGVNADGSIIVGAAYVAGLGGVAVLWTTGEPMLVLGALPTETPYTVALDVSDDGSIIVGFGYTGRDQRAVLWSPGTGVVDLNNYLPSRGVNLEGWTLTRAAAVSADGRTIVGYGTHDGRTEAWIADLGKPCAADFNLSGGVDSRDYFEFLVVFFGVLPGADFNRDGTVNSVDYFDYVTAFLAGC